MIHGFYPGSWERIERELRIITTRIDHVILPLPLHDSGIKAIPKDTRYRFMFEWRNSPDITTDSVRRCLRTMSILHPKIPVFVSIPSSVILESLTVAGLLHKYHLPDNDYMPTYEREYLAGFTDPFVLKSVSESLRWFTANSVSQTHAKTRVPFRTMRQLTDTVVSLL